MPERSRVGTRFDPIRHHAYRGPMPDDNRSILQGIRQKIEVGFDQAERGELFDGDEVFREIWERIDAEKMTETQRVQSPNRSR